MTDKLTPEAVKAALEAASPGPWVVQIDDDAFCNRVRQGSKNGWNVASAYGRDGFRQWPDVVGENDARLIAMAPDLAAAYLAAMEEIERLRKRVEAADELADAMETFGLDDSDGTPIGAISEALAAYRATDQKT